MENKLETIEDVLSLPKLKEFAKGKHGEFVTLVDIEHTKSLLKELAGKYEKLEVTRENYKDEGTKAEKELRETRYALQRIHKSNNKILNEVKKKEKETYEELVGITEGVEKRIYDEITAIKEIIEKEKAEKKRQEQERIERIERALKETEFSFEKAIATAKNKEDLAEYDKFLEDLTNNFKDFQDFEFQAKRLHAIYTGRRAEVVAQIERHEKEEKEREELRKKLEQEDKLKEKVADHRKSHLLKIGFEFDHLDCYIGHGMRITDKEIKKLDEVEWYSTLDEIEKSKKRIEKEKEDKLKKDVLDAKKNWEELLTVFEGLGGDIKGLKLKKAEVPTPEKIAHLKRITVELQRKKKAERLTRVKEDIDPFKKDVLEFMTMFDRNVKKTKFNIEDSRELMESFSKGMENLINEIFGGIINS